jgi:hypothetical protein
MEIQESASIQITLMDLTAASITFATIVGLICNFRQEKGEREALDHQKFVEWLGYHRHEDLKNLIVNTAALRTEVDNLLRSDHVQMLQKLDSITEILLTLLSRVDNFRGLAQAIAPNIELSEQAISILRQFIDSGGHELFYADYGNGQFVLQMGNGAPIGITEPRFIKDDLDQLAALQLFSVSYNSDGNPIYVITRGGARLLNTIDEKPAN